MLAGLVAAFVLFLREGLEASLIVSILLAALRQLGQARQMRAVWIGIGLAVLASLGGGVILYATIRAYDGSTFQTIFETITYLVAVVLLTSMTFWLQRHSRSLKKELTSQAKMAGSAFGLGLLAFFTVGREGLETAVFSLALAFQTSGLWLLLGALLGLAGPVLADLPPGLSARLPHLLPCNGHPAPGFCRWPARQRHSEHAGAGLDLLRHHAALELRALPERGQHPRRYPAYLYWLCRSAYRAAGLALHWLLAPGRFGLRLDDAQAPCAC